MMARRSPINAPIVHDSAGRPCCESAHRCRPIRAKRRFQDGAQSAPRVRVTKAWCQRAFDRMWQERLREVNEQANTRRSGNEMSVPVR